MDRKKAHTIGSYEVKFLSKNIIQCTLSGDLTGETVTGSMAETEKLANEIKSRGMIPRLLIDMRGITSQNSGARTKSKELVTYGFDKIAIYGAGRTLKTIGQYIARIAGMGDYARFFATRTQAVSWLKSSKKPAVASRGRSLRLIALIPGLIGAATLIGWHTQNDILTAVIPGLKPMNPVVALTMIILTVAMSALLSRRSTVRSTIVWLASGWMVVFGALVALQLFFNIPIGIDRWLFANKVAALPNSMGLTSMGTALLFIYTGAALTLALGDTKNVWNLRAFRIVTMLIGITLAILCALYFFGLMNPAIGIPVPVNAVIAFIVSTIVITGYIYTPTLFPVATRLFRTYRSGLAVFILVSFITGFAWQQTQMGLESNTQAEAEQAFERTATAVESRVTSYIDTLRGYKAFFESSGYVTDVEFERYFHQSKLQTNYPGFSTLSFIRVVTPQTKAQIEQEVRAQADESSQLQGFTPQTQDNGNSYILMYAVPATTTVAVGTNIGTLSGRTEVLEAARDSGEPRASEALSFTNANGGADQAGFLISIPVYVGASDTTAERQANIYGFVNTVFRNEIIFEEIFKSLRDEPQADVRITHAATNRVLYESNPSLHIAATDAPRASRTINVAGQEWTIAIYTVAHYGETAVGNILPYAVIGGGMTLALLAGYLVVSLTRRREEVLLLASSMTEDLNNERNQAEQMRQKDDAILASIGDAVFALDTSGRITLFNPAAETVSGHRAQDAIGQHYADILPFISKKNQKQSGLFISRALRGHVTSMKNDTMLIRKDGSTIDVADSAAPIRDNTGEILGVIVVFRDVSKERQLEEAKSEFVSLASHQLRTPLSAINWYSEMLLAGDAGKLTDDQNDYMREIYEGNQRMVELVDSLLNVSRIEVGKLKNDPRDVSMLELADSLEKEMQVSIVNKKLKFNREFTGKIPSVYADPKLVRMIVQNLLSNAVKYTPDKGEVTFAMRPASAADTRAAHLPDNQKYIYMSVKDTGYGIPHDQQSKIFGKLFRADNVRKLDVEGTGLGLYIVKEVVKKLGGNIWFESIDTVGTTFYVVIPITTKPS